MEEEKSEWLKKGLDSLLIESGRRIRTLADTLEKSKQNPETSSRLDRVNQLLKKVKNLEDDVENLEDDLDDYQNRLKGKNSEIDAVRDELDKESRDNKSLKGQLSKAQEELGQTSGELSLKMSSLSFVQEILTAKTSMTDRDEKLGQRVDDLVVFVEDDMKNVIKDFYEGNVKDKQDPIFGTALDRWAAVAKKNWLNNKTTIAFVGEFSAGKTSIVNRILSMDNPSVPLLPVSTKATTAIPTYISGGDTVSYRFVTPNDEIKSISEETFKKVNKEVLEQVRGVSSLIKYFVMRYKNDNLTTLSILDTPGFSSNDNEDSMRTMEVINECDALFWVFDVNAGTVNRSSMDIIKKNLRRPLWIVINKVDTKADSEVIQVEKLIGKTLADEGIPVEGFIRFSQNAPLENIMDPIMSIRHDGASALYLNSLLNCLNSLTDKQEGVFKKSEKNAKSIQAECNKLKENYDNALENLQDNCQSVADIPRFKEGGLFRTERFEMSIDEYNALNSILNDIASDLAPDLANQYNDQMEKVKNLNDAWKNSSVEKAKYLNLMSCRDTLKKKINLIKKGN